MGKIGFLLIFSVMFSFATGDVLRQCNLCHEKKSPPFNMIYKKYLLIYSSKKRVEKAMTDFLINPTLKKSLLPKEMKKRFFPQEHPKFKKSEAKKAVKKIVKDYDLIKRIKIIK